MELWKESSSYVNIFEFVLDLQNSIVGLSNDAKVVQSSNVSIVLKALDHVNELIDSNPVVKDSQVSRFGKGEFRDFYDAVSACLESLLESMVIGHLDQVCAYFNESWGNRTRIDYGLGHELHFICFLLCLVKQDTLNSNDYPALVIKVFIRYMTIMRRLQKIYWLEPAGLHGVWGLDDYHFLPFLFGAAQLATHPHMKPKLIHNTELVEMYHSQYMYFECINFINNIKTIPQNQTEKLSLRWHSPMLDDISLARLWQKVKEGMIKMYKAEVLGKLPIVQHIIFGDLIPAPKNISPSQGNREYACGHFYGLETSNTWGDCCGIKVPSAIAASESLRMNSQKKIKPIPFD